MSDNKQATTDTETILMALDQISQTIDMTPLEANTTVH